MQSITITGALGKDATLRQTQGGDDVLSFNVGVSQGYGEQKSTNWYRCSVWGKRGRTISQYLLKGVKVTVQGELTIGEYEGKPQFDIRVNEVEWERRAERQTGSASPPPQQGYDSDLDDDVPFIASAWHLERRVS